MKKFIFLSILALGISSCESFTQGVIRDIDLPAHTPELVGTLLADPSDSSLVGIVSQTRGLLDSNSTALLDNAVLNLYQDGDLIHTWSTQDPLTGYYVLDLNDTLGMHPGKLTFEVLHPEFDAITASDQFPPQAIISDAFINPGQGQIFTFPADELVVSVKDIPGVNQHYIFTADLRYRDFDLYQDTNWYSIELFTDDQRAIQIGGAGAVMLSENGLDADLTISMSCFDLFGSTGQNDIEYRIHVKTLSDASWNYYRSIASYEQAQNNPFSEPVLIYSNMNEGYGVFALSNTTEIRI